MISIETQSDDRLQALSQLATPLYLFDTDSFRICWANASALKFWSARSLNDLCQREFINELSSSARRQLAQIARVCHHRRQIVSRRYTVYPKNTPRTADFFLSGFAIQNRQSILLIEIVTENDNTVGVDLLRISALMHTNTMISAYDASYRLIYANPAAYDFMQDRFTFFTDMLQDTSDLHRVRNAFGETRVCNLELEVKSITGPSWHDVHIKRVDNPMNGRVMYMVSATDVTERRLAQQSAYKLAFTDALTGLPNRAALNLYLEELMAVHNTTDEEPPSAQFAIFFLDLDRFKIINDSLGHAAGDQLLINVSMRLKRALGAHGMVYRLGGDEFVMVVTHSTNQLELRNLAESILFANAEPVLIAKHPVRVLPSIGICRYPEDGNSIAQIMENADAAMYMAKSDNSGYCFYDRKMASSISESVKDRMGIENDLNNAIQNNEFQLYFQPKVASRNLSVCGVEALIRWHHPTRGLVPPDQFIGIAEETGQIIDLGNWVLKSAMQQQRAWQEQGINIPVSLNISARQFSANDLLANVSDALSETGCDPGLIELEITESMLIGEPDGVQATLQQLSSIGIKLALDDFGTGYSNLAHLQKYPLDTLKVDKAFLADQRRSLLMGTILSMGRVLGLSMVAEGVETAAQADWLIARGCDQMQGYYFSKPMPVDETTRYLEDNGAPRCCSVDLPNRIDRAA